MFEKSKESEALNFDKYILSGQISEDDLISALEYFFEVNTSANILWDLREAEFDEELSISTLRNIANIIKRKSPLRTRGKTALVASSDFGFGLARTYEAFAAMEGIKNKIAVFRSMEKAVEWLEEE